MNHCTAYDEVRSLVGFGGAEGHERRALPPVRGSSGGSLVDELDVGRQHVVVDLGCEPLEVDASQHVEVALGGIGGPEPTPLLTREHQALDRHPARRGCAAAR